MHYHVELIPLRYRIVTTRQSELKERDLLYGAYQRRSETVWVSME